MPGSNHPVAAETRSASVRTALQCCVSAHNGILCHELTKALNQNDSRGT